MTGKIQTKQKVINKKFQKRHKTHGSFKRNVSITQAEKLINCNTQAVCMPPAGVSMLRFLATVFLAVAKYTGRMHAPCGGLHVTVPCDRVRSVTKFRILHKKSKHALWG
jgi:hypothetical protein